MNKIYLKPGDKFVVTTEVEILGVIEGIGELPPAPITSLSWESAADLAGYQNPYDIHDQKVGEMTSWGTEGGVISNVYRDVSDGRFYYNESGE